MQNNIITIHITKKANNHISEIYNSNNKIIGMRLNLKKAGCTGFKIENNLIYSLHNEDVLINSNSIIKIYIPKHHIIKYNIYFNKLNIDILEESLNQYKLIYIPYLKNNICGCGESFTLYE